MNKQKQHLPIIETPDLSDSIAESPIIQWIAQNGRTLLWIFLGLLAAALLIHKIFWGAFGDSAQDYYKADGEYYTFDTSTDPKVQQEALNTLSTLLKRRPDLQSKYDGRIAQTLLTRDDLKQALPFAERTLARTSQDNLPFYADYANTTLLISAQKYEDALKTALALKDKMIAEAKENGGAQEFGDALYLFNLLRIAMLQQQLGQNAEELKAWQEFKQAAVRSSETSYFVQPEMFETILKQLQEGKASLFNYIEAREKLLKQ